MVLYGVCILEIGTSKREREVVVVVSYRGLRVFCSVSVSCVKQKELSARVAYINFFLNVK